MTTVRAWGATVRAARAAETDRAMAHETAHATAPGMGRDYLATGRERVRATVLEMAPETGPGTAPGMGRGKRGRPARVHDHRRGRRLRARRRVWGEAARRVARLRH